LSRCASRPLCWAVAAAIMASLGSPAQAGDSDPGAIVSVAYSGVSEPHAMAQWVSTSGDAQGRPFIIVDKVSARVLAFDGTGTLVQQSEALLGMAIGDVSPPGIGSMRLADIGPSMRITPAGRFDAHLGTNLAGKQILWVNYDEALSLHAVVPGTASERRLARLESPTAADNRISYGCINVPAAFFHEVVAPLFATNNGVVYILPDDTSA